MKFKLPAPTVASVTKNLQTIIESLAVVQNEQFEEASKQRTIANNAQAKAIAAEAEIEQAQRIEKKISDLLS